MNRLALWWNAVTAWFVSWKSHAQLARHAAAGVRAVRRELRDAQRDVASKEEHSSRLDSEIQELRHELETAEREIGKLENELALSNRALEYQVQWQEKVLERQKAETSIYVRRRIEAVSGDTPTLLDELGE